MKKIIFILMMAMMVLPLSAKLTHSVKYVDLGLPSGTQWKESDEQGLYTYEEAVAKFGDNVPSIEQCEELEKQCRWTWEGNGYKITGPNGRSIHMQAKGGIDCRGNEDGEGEYGYFWSSTPKDERFARFLFFREDDVQLRRVDRCYRFPVRLVK